MYPRPGFPVNNESLPQGVRIVDAPLFPWSSTEIREALRAGREVAGMLPPAVEEMLKERDLLQKAGTACTDKT